MRTRIVIGAGAWLLGAAAATAGGLLVVSELGAGIFASPASDQSGVAAAGQAQASQAAAQASSPTPRSQRSTGGKSGPGGASTGGTVLGSPGGTVVAQCAATGAFLLSWSPQQGFTASSVARGPATTARVVFAGTASTVTMAVSCASGVPAAATTVASAAAPPAPAPSATGDDNGGGGNSGPGGGGGDGGGGGGDG
jgi:hypothetical protein